MSILPTFVTIPSSSSQSSLLLHSDMLRCINSSMLQLCFSSQKHNDNIGIDRVAILCNPKKLCPHLVAVPGHCCTTRHRIQESLGSWHWKVFLNFCWAFIKNTWLLHHMTLCRRICCPHPHLKLECVDGVGYAAAKYEKDSTQHLLSFFMSRLLDFLR
jgi:hypothetical protein